MGIPDGKRDDLIVHDTAPFNAEPPGPVLADALLTPTGAFYCRNHGPIPDFSADQWQLSVGGAVAEPLTLDHAALTTRFAAHEVVATLACAGNRRAELAAVRPLPDKEPWEQGAISTAVWRGARLADVLRAADVDPDPEAELHVAFTAPDISPKAAPPQPFGASIPLAKALSAEVLLAWEMNGTALPRLHGGPVRVVVPGYIGARSVKWVTGIVVQPFPSHNYFQQVDYRLDGVALTALPLNCAILDPDDGTRVDGGPVRLRGYAIAEDTRRITRVEVSTDGAASWQPARLAPAEHRWAWRHWSLSVDAAPGPLGVLARAWDDTGATQPESPVSLWNSGGYVNNAWARSELMVGSG
ncbi:sulfite oxidase [Mycobacterium sp. 1274756.6]|uniref:sulfite oxidase n=1 Tax=Mycobacterium sp. 1274756.6 TaxID=1834076 RepID=UPI0007FF39AE|nr:sulfite oxidase [Mycobacterium sp. 1274756.6]OBJ69872.1 sulfite oxidase [Mycobacterium sp. 1274756.6]